MSQSNANPKPKSFHSISVEHPGFATHPKFWTSNHLSLVNCRFEEIQIHDTHDCASPCKAKPSGLALSARRLARDPSPGMKFFWATEILLRKAGPLTPVKTQLSFTYARHRIRLADSDCHVQRVKDDRSVRQLDPIIGYYMYNVDQERQSMLRVPPSRACENDPVKRLYNIRLRRVTPENRLNDPYLVCLLLSLAQLQRRQLQVPKTVLFLARLLVTYMSDKTYAYVFKADIPHQLLDCLDNPTCSLDDVTFPTIYFIKIPFEPYDTFTERMETHLVGSEYALPSDPLVQLGLGQTVGEKKRKKKERKLGSGKEKSGNWFTTLEQRGKKRKRSVQERPARQVCKVKVA
ncbi:hypothetical protein ACHAQD_010891 [Fusarium lateritium]